MNFLNHPLVAVLVGALIAWVSGVFTHRRQLQAQKSAELRSKLEMLMVECSQIDAWAKKQENHYLAVPARFTQQAEVSPIDKIWAVAILYFPEIYDKASDLDSAGFEFVKYLHDICKTRQRQNTMQLAHPENPPDLAGHKQNISEAQSELIDVIRTLMKKLCDE